MKFYRCVHCHSLVAKLNEPGSTPSCCGEMMQELIPNEGDGAFEKHVPEVKIADNRVLVQVGSALHPMTEAHYIEWIYLKTDKALHAKELHPNEEPKAAFLLEENEKPLEVYAYCNLHGLYLKKIA